jgi:metallophosphoesterase superfamily enzyme
MNLHKYGQSYNEAIRSGVEGHAHPWIEIRCRFGRGVSLMVSSNFSLFLNTLVKFGALKKIMATMNFHSSVVRDKFCNG